MTPSTLVERRLLHLLSAALREETPDHGLFVGMQSSDWRAVIELARKQCVLALVADRVLCLPKELLPERTLRLEIGLGIQQTEDEYDRLTKVLHAVGHEYEAQGLPFVLLKGHTMAHLYPQPKLRASGDIDLYLYRPGDYQRANDYARSRGYRLQGDSLYEQLYWRGRTAVENHLHLAYFGIPRYDKALADILRPVIERDEWAYLAIDDVRYRTLPLELNAVYCFQHILHHFSYLGIGLRQIADWMLLLERHAEAIDLDRFTAYAEALDLLRPMRLFALAIVRHLGGRAEAFPLALPTEDRDLRLADMIMADVLTVGNFGFEAFAGKRFSSMWSRRWFMFRRTLVRSWRIAPVSPEHIRPIPLVAFITRMKLLVRQPLRRRKR